MFQLNPNLRAALDQTWVRHRAVLVSWTIFEIGVDKKNWKIPASTPGDATLFTKVFIEFWLVVTKYL